MKRQPVLDKRVIDVRATRTGSTLWRTLAISADATMLELHLALLGAFAWTGPYGPLERAFRFEIGGDVYENGKGSRTALRRVLNVGQPFGYACRVAELVLACEPIRSYEVPSRRHYPKVLAAEDDGVVQTATWSAQSALRREYREYESDYSIQAGTPASEPSNRAFRHGLFAAVIAGPMVSPMEWLGLLIDVRVGPKPGRAERRDVGRHGRV